LRGGGCEAKKKRKLAALIENPVVREKARERPRQKPVKKRKGAGDCAAKGQSDQGNGWAGLHFRKGRRQPQSAAEGYVHKKDSKQKIKSLGGRKKREIHYRKRHFPMRGEGVSQMKYVS